MNKIVVYYRHAPSEPDASEAALAEQRAAVADYVRDNEAVVAAEFTEEASGSTGPEFDAACRACATLGTQLVVASVQAIGSGEPLSSMSFPVTMDEDLSRQSELLPDIDPIVLGAQPAAPEPTIPMPAEAPSGLFLHAPNAGQSWSPIYLCNNGETDVDDLTVLFAELGGLAFDGLPASRRQGGDETETRIARLAKGACVLFGDWDRWIDDVRAHCLFHAGQAPGTVARASYRWPDRFEPLTVVNLALRDRAARAPAAGEITPLNATYSTVAIELDGFLTCRLYLDEARYDPPLLARIGVLHGRVFDGGPPSLGMVVDERVTRLVSVEEPVRAIEGTAMSQTDLGGVAAIIERLRAPLLDYWRGHLTTAALCEAVEAMRVRP